MKAFNHCKSSVKYFGGQELDYHKIHAWFDDWVPVRSIAEQHVREDLGFIPSVQDWLKEIQPKSWMASTKKNIKKMNLT